MNEVAPTHEWSEYRDFGSILSEVMKNRGIKTDKELADAATRVKIGPSNERIRRNISNWRNGVGPNERSLDDLNRVRKALNISNDNSDPLAIAWDKCLEKALAKKKTSSPPPPPPPGKPSLMYHFTRLGQYISNVHSKNKFYMPIAMICTIVLATIIFKSLNSSLSTHPFRYAFPSNVLRLKAGYIFPDSSVRLLRDEEINSRNNWELFVGRNEIYARHGRVPSGYCLQDHFKRIDRSTNPNGWYIPVSKAVDGKDFNKEELANVQAISTTETSRGGAYTCETNSNF